VVRWKRALITAGVAVLFIGLLAAAFIASFVFPDVSSRSVGGNWIIVSQHAAGEHSTYRELRRRGPGGEAVVQRLVHDYRYYGDDCVAYAAAVAHRETYFVACGDRPPVKFGGGDYLTWHLEPDAVQQAVSSTDGAVSEGRRLSIPALKALAYGPAPARQ
jgi:hypothetical protein